jgi:flagellar assembly protein FliH
MRSSKIIPGDRLSAFERWELPAMAEAGKKKTRQPRAEAVSEVEEVPPPITAEQIETIQREAYQEGFELGKKEGREAGAAEVRANAQRLAQLARGLARPLEELDAHLEEELVELALVLARQLIRRELQTSPGEVVAVVREAVAALPSSASNIKVHLHPADAKLVREALSLTGGDDSWKVIEDPVLSLGGCRVESDRSRVDGTMETRLNAVMAKLLGVERGDEREDGSH